MQIPLESPCINYQNLHFYITEAPLYLYFHRFRGDLCKLVFILPEPRTFSSFFFFNSVTFWEQLNFLLCSYDQIVWCFLLKCFILNRKFILQQIHNQTQFSTKCVFCCMVKEMEFYCRSVDCILCVRDMSAVIWCFGHWSLWWWFVRISKYVG